MRFLALAATLSVLVGASLPTTHAAETKPLRALLITGGCCHDYPRQKEILPQGISARANVEWTIVHDPRTGTTGKIDIYAKDDWAKGYDVVVHNECFADEKEPAWLERILAPHRAGMPALVIHCAMHCYRAPNEEWFKFCGVTSHRHGSHFAYPMKLAKADHPIVLGMPATWQTPVEDLYNIVKVWPDATPLASGYSHETKKDEVNVWINTYGKGRVFGTTLGHYNKTMEEAWFLDLTARGLLWACGKLGDDGKPLPGYNPTR
jgi:type 1 glutamine amidotransferase